MATIKEMAKQYDRVIEVINDHESIVDTSGREYFELGANAAIDEIWSYIKELPINSCGEADNQMMLLSRIQKLKGE